MTFEELKDAVEGLFAYDMGAVDSGIHDETLRQSVKDFVRALPTIRRRYLLSRIMASFLTDEALLDGYGWEDAHQLGDWYQNMFGVG